MSGYSGHSAKPADGATFGKLSESNLRSLQSSTEGRLQGLDAWFGDSMQSSKATSTYEVVEYRKGLGNRK